MCGYCTERIAFEVSEQEKRGEKATLDTFAASTHYLQATSDVSAALAEIVATAEKANVAVLDLVDGEAVICRAAELLFTEGYASPAYQRLLNDRLFRQLLEKECGGLKHVDAISGSQRSQLGLLYQQSTYTDEKAASRLVDGSLSLPECEGLLRWYIGWWLEGEIGCCEEMPSKDETIKLRGIFRTMFFSVVCLDRYQGAKPILLDLVKKTPVGTFDGLDLWLQRQAALSLYDLHNLDPFLANLHEIRASLIYYLDLKRGLTLRQRESILEVASKRPEADKTDEFFTLSAWLA